jgi:hypothetical protein
MTVDEFVKTRVLPEYHEVVAMIRELMREMAPEAKEYIGYDMPSYKINNIFAYFIPNKNGITFSFTYGTQFEDKFGLLKGVGKSSRHVKIKSVEKVNQEALKYYIQQALELDKK